MAALLRLGWSWSNAERSLWAVGPERGFSASASVDLTHPVLASDYRGYRAQLGVSAYATMPWLRHHSLALHATGGTGGGSFPGAPYYVGGFVDVAFLDTAKTLLQQGAFLQQGGVVLRGYPVAVEVGRNVALFNAEYRFPILNVDRGLSTLPLLLNRLSGNVFVDYGSAFDDARAAAFKTGVGAELWAEMNVGYFVGFTMRGGYARGLASQGTDKIYFVAAVPY
jgi:outer membrane protein assembly factor BamA